MLKRISLVILATSFTLWGQVNGGASTMIFPPPALGFAEIKQHLGLTDAQVEQLVAILEEKAQASREVYKQIAEKQAELRSLLESGSRDVNRIGQLMLDIHTLGKQAPPSGAQWRQRALAVLTPEQRTKLSPLDQAMKLSTPAYQAVTLDLIDSPPPAPPRILPAGVLPTLPAPGTPVPLPQPVP